MPKPFLDGTKVPKIPNLDVAGPIRCLHTCAVAAALGRLAALISTAISHLQLPQFLHQKPGSTAWINNAWTGPSTTGLPLPDWTLWTGPGLAAGLAVRLQVLGWWIGAAGLGAGCTSLYSVGCRPLML